MRPALAALSLLTACQATIPPYTVHVPPRFAEVRPPTSVLFVDGEIPLTSLGAALEGALPPEFSARGSTTTRAGALSGSYHLVRGPSQLRAVARGIELKLTALGEVELGAGLLHCKGQRIGVEVSARGRPSLAGNELILMADPNIHARVVGNLRCMGVTVPVEPLLQPVLDLVTHAVEAALPLARIPVDALLRTALEQLAVPRLLRVGGHDACLDLAPSAIVTAPVGGAGDQLRVKLGVEAAPRLTLGPCSEKAPALPGSILSYEQTLGEQFTVDVAFAVAHADLAGRLDKALVGQRFGARGQSLEVRAAELGDAGGRVLVRLQVVGAFDGQLFLWGTPEVVQRDQKWWLTVPDLQVALETRSLLSRLKLAVWKLLDGGLPAAVESRVRLDVSGRVAQARAAILQSWDKPLAAGFSLQASLDELRPAEVISRPGVLAAHVQLSGRAVLHR